MSFKCDKCSNRFEVGNVPVRHVTQVRPVEYVYGLTKVFSGKEIVKEVSVCNACSTILADLEPQVVQSEAGKIKQIVCVEPKKKLPKNFE